MRHHVRRRAVHTLGSLVAGAALVACGVGTDPAAVRSPSATSSEAPTATDEASSSLSAEEQTTADVKRVLARLEEAAGATYLRVDAVGQDGAEAAVLVVTRGKIDIDNGTTSSETRYQASDPADLPDEVVGLVIKIATMDSPTGGLMYMNLSGTDDFAAWGDQYLQLAADDLAAAAEVTDFSVDGAAAIMGASADLAALVPTGYDSDSRNLLIDIPTDLAFAMLPNKIAALVAAGGFSPSDFSTVSKGGVTEVNGTLHVSVDLSRLGKEIAGKVDGPDGGWVDGTFIGVRLEMLPQATAPFVQLPNPSVVVTEVPR